MWEGASAVDSLGWTAEMRIPLSQLRFPRDSVQTWGLQIWRQIARRNEQDMWSFWRRNESGGPGYFGTITGLALAQQPRQMELLPYVVTKSTFALPTSGDPFKGSRTMNYRAGGDVKLNLSSNLTLDATVNPDFGQVEVDPAVVNLSAFETTFQEKRPFFVANSGAFSFGGLNCFFCSNVSSLNVFYSRRIGRVAAVGGGRAGRGGLLRHRGRVHHPRRREGHRPNRRRPAGGVARRAHESRDGAVHRERRAGELAGARAGSRATHELLRRTAAPGFPWR